MPHVKTKLLTQGFQPQKIPVTKCNMQFVVDNQNAYFYIKTRTQKKLSRCHRETQDWALGGIRAPRKHPASPRNAPALNPSVFFETRGCPGGREGRCGPEKMGGRREGPGWPPKHTETHAEFLNRRNGVCRHRCLLQNPSEASHRVPRTLAMADAHEHPLTVFVHAGHGKNPQVRGQEACRCVRDGFVVHGRRNLDELVGRHELVGDRES